MVYLLRKTREENKNIENMLKAERLRVKQVIEELKKEREKTAVDCTCTNNNNNDSSCNSRNSAIDLKRFELERRQFESLLKKFEEENEALRNKLKQAEERMTILNIENTCLVKKLNHHLS